MSLRKIFENKMYEKYGQLLCLEMVACTYLLVINYLLGWLSYYTKQADLIAVPTGTRRDATRGGGTVAGAGGGKTVLTPR